MDLTKYVYRSQNDLNDGCCVLVGKYIITAGHLVSCHDFIVEIEGVTYYLSKENALVYMWNGKILNGSSNDIAVFKIKESTSPIEFDNNVPQVGMKLASISYEHVVELTDQPDLLFGGKLTTEYLRLNKCEAEISNIEGNFFQCMTGIKLRPGSSGSPIFNGNKLFGILHGGQEGTNLCVFQSATSILTLIKEAEEGC